LKGTFFFLSLDFSSLSPPPHLKIVGQLTSPLPVQGRLFWRRAVGSTPPFPYGLISPFPPLSFSVFFLPFPKPPEKLSGVFVATPATSTLRRQEPFLHKKEANLSFSSQRASRVVLCPEMLPFHFPYSSLKPAIRSGLPLSPHLLLRNKIVLRRFCFPIHLLRSTSQPFRFYRTFLPFFPLQEKWFSHPATHKEAVMGVPAPLGTFFLFFSSRKGATSLPLCFCSRFPLLVNIRNSALLTLRISLRYI